MMDSFCALQSVVEFYFSTPWNTVNVEQATTGYSLQGESIFCSFGWQPIQKTVSHWHVAAVYSMQCTVDASDVLWAIFGD